MPNFDGLDEFAAHRWTTWVIFCSLLSSSKNSSQAHPQGKRTLINGRSQVLRLLLYTKFKSWRIILSLGSPFYGSRKKFIVFVSNMNSEYSSWQCNFLFPSSGGSREWLYYLQLQRKLATWSLATSTTNLEVWKHSQLESFLFQSVIKSRTYK